MRIVIDVGCGKWGGDQSIPSLIEEFQPDMLYGFDPGREGIEAACEDLPPVEERSCEIALHRAAAWTHDGTVPFVEANLGGHVDPHGKPVECHDLARLINKLAETYSEIILKIDAEGAEYVLLPHLIAHDADLCLKLALVEWHCDVCGYGIWNKTHPVPCDGDHEMWIARRDEIEQGLRCEVREWTL